MNRAERIAEKLRTALSPVHLSVEDESHHHAGHAGAAPGGETHYQVVIVSDAFTGVGRVQRQRMVYAALADELRSGLHALAITALSPEQHRDAGG